MAIIRPSMFESSMLRIMEFQVLGSLRVEDAGAQFVLGGPGRRAVLALLIASAGTPVAMDTLLMGAYGPDANPKARRSIQTYISGFRRSMGVAIGRTGEGYVLDIDPGSIDAVRFEKLIRDAKSIMNEEMSSALLREALDLWRGRPYADVEPTDALEPEIRRLEALWVQAIDARIQLDLSAGRHREVLAELESLIAQHPHREALRGHQMVALYRCGRQADALHAFRQTETRLRNDLGVDPSPALRRLEYRILEQDPTLDYQPHARARPIPIRYTSFIGRETEFEAVRDLVMDHRMVTITGPGGIGKSSLGAEVASILSREMATVYVPVEANRDADLWELLAASLGLQPSRGVDLADLLVEALGEQPILLLLDGCEHIIDDLPAILIEILTRCADVRFLITSREAISITGERVFQLGPLDHGDSSASNDLFLERAGFDPEDLDVRETAQVSDIGRRLSGLPLGLELASVRARTLSLDQIVERLNDQTSLLRAKRGGVSHHRSLVEALDWSYDLLEQDMRRSFRRLGAFPTGVIHDDAAAKVLDVGDASDILGELADASLVVRPIGDEAHFRMLEPIRQFAEMRLDVQGELDSARMLYAEWIVELCSRAHYSDLRGDLATALGSLHENAPSIAATARWAIEQNHPDIVLGIVAHAGRMWPKVAVPILLIEPAMRALEHHDAVDASIKIRATAHTAFLHTPGDPVTAFDLLVQLDTDASDAWDAETRQIVASVHCAVLARTAPWGLSTERALEALRYQDESIQLVVSLGYPSEPHLFNRALMLESLGRYVEEREHIDLLLAWAGDSRPLWRAMALLAVTKRQTLDGEHDAAMETAREASRLFVDEGNLDFASQAEAWVALAHIHKERYELAHEAIQRVDDYRAHVGLPPMSEWESDVVVQCAGGLEDWNVFEEAMRAFFAEAPDRLDHEAYVAFMEGDPGDVPRFAQLMVPLSRWFASMGREQDSARIIAAAPMVYNSTNKAVWEAFGDVERMDRMAKDLGTEIRDGVPQNLDDMYQFMRDRFEAVSGEQIDHAR
jgi:predicted ATPase/DNA-binding SARP family transcriptional activator